MSRNTTDIANELLAENAALKAQIAALDERLIRYAGIATARAEHVAQLEAQLARYSMSPGHADQRKAESTAVRVALGFGADADDVAPCDLVAVINALRAEGFERAIAELKDLAARSKQEAPKAAEQTHAAALYLMTLANQLRGGK